MKKKIILLLILVISLFIYSSRVNAVVMWRECGNIEDENKIVQDGESLVFARYVGEEDGKNYVLPLFKKKFDIRLFYPLYVWKEGGSDFFESSYCPVKLDKFAEQSSFDLNNLFFHFSGKKPVDYNNSNSYKMTSMDGYQLAIYKIQGSDIYIMEAYDRDGTYGIIAGNNVISAAQSFLSSLSGYSDSLSSFGEDIYVIQAAKYVRGRENYFKITDPNQKVLYGDVATLIASIKNNSAFAIMQNIYNIPFSDDSQATIVDYNSPILYSTPTDTSVWPIVNEWGEKVESYVNSTVIDQYDSIFANNGKYNDTYKKVMEISESIEKNNSYSFPNDFDFEKFINEMIESKGTSGKSGPLDDVLNSNITFPAYDENCSNFSGNIHTDEDSVSLGGYVSCNYFGTNQAGLDDRTIGFNSSKVVFNVFQLSILTQLQNFKKSNPDMRILSYKEECENYLIALTKVAAYIQSKYSQYDDLLNDFVIECKNDLRQRGIEITVDCNDLLGDELINKIGKYVDIVKIAVPIILILFGIIDFAKAMFAGDDDKMKKAQKSFMIRIAIAVLFFLTPYIVKLLLSIANKVWGFIKPNNCNIWTSK